MLDDFLFKKRNSWMFKIHPTFTCIADFVPYILMLVAFVLSIWMGMKRAFLVMDLFQVILLFILTDNLKKHMDSMYVRGALAFTLIIPAVVLFFVV